MIFVVGTERERERGRERKDRQVGALRSRSPSETALSLHERSLHNIKSGMGEERRGM